MKVLLSHNLYQQPGGEDQVFESEGALLEQFGHRVVRHTSHNDELEGMSPPALAAATLWNRAKYRELRALVRRERPDVVHFHNTFPLVSPAAYHAARAEGVPVVQTLHNYRLICPGATLMREGRTCEDCVGRAAPWRGVARACYRGSRAASGAAALMLTAHRAMRTWARAVNVYVALTEFARGKFVAGGLPARKIVVKSNFVEAGVVPGGGRGDFALFVGRLSPEKGVGTLLRAWRSLPDVPLKVVGDGPLLDEVRAVARERPGGVNVEALGRLPRREVFGLMRRARFLVFPSEWYEGFPLTIAEAFACGTPVVASRLGAMAEIVEDGRTGLLFSPGDSEDLAAKARRAWEHEAEAEEMRRGARREYEEKYTAERNYHALMGIYERAAAAG
jgi:glycosyltransferase involved in cell wall biosynthesis